MGSVEDKTVPKTETIHQLVGGLIGDFNGLLTTDNHFKREVDDEEEGTRKRSKPAEVSLEDMEKAAKDGKVMDFKFNCVVK
jgi:hypothetical protein